MSRIYFSIAGLVLILWSLVTVRVAAQNRTNVNLEAENRPDLATKAEESVSRLLTELNRASYFDGQLDLSSEAVTEGGQADVLSAWDESHFRCPKTRLTRTLNSSTRDAVFEVGSIPLLVENGDQPSKERSAVLVVDRSGRIDGFFFASERKASRPTGSITVRTEPTDATVVSAIGGGREEQAPAHFEGVIADAYAFNVRKANYSPVLDTTLLVKANQHVEYTIRLVPEPGLVRFDKLSEETRLFVDGRERSVSSSMVRLASGSHRLRVTKDHHTTWDSTVTLAPGDTIRLDPHLHREYAELVVHSDPEGASLLVDGRASGHTPVDTSLAAGRTYQIRLRKEGHIPTSETRVVAAADSAIKRRVVLTPVTWKSEVADARLTDLRFDRMRDSVRIEYALIGVAGETYDVDVDIEGTSGKPIELQPGAVTGNVGGGLTPGSEKTILLKDVDPGAALIRLQLDEMGGNNRLLYVIGSAVAAVGGGTLAALLLRGGDGGGRSFPPPPGLPR